MPKVDPRNEVGAIVHAVSNRVLSDHTAKNIYGNVNYAKTFLQGTVINVFDGRTPGGKNAVCKLMADFQMPSEDPVPGVESRRVDIHRQHCTLGPVPADELNQLARAGAISDCLRISIILSSPCSCLTVALPPLSPAIVIIATAVAARRGQGFSTAIAIGVVVVVIPIGAAATTDAVLSAAAMALLSMTAPPTGRSHHRARRT